MTFKTSPSDISVSSGFNILSFRGEFSGSDIFGIMPLIPCINSWYQGLNTLEVEDSRASSIWESNSDG